MNPLAKVLFKLCSHCMVLCFVPVLRGSVCYVFCYVWRKALLQYIFNY